LGRCLPADGRSREPGAPWPQIDDLAAQVSAAGYSLEERLTVHPEYIADSSTWIDERMLGPVLSLAGPDGLATRHRTTPRRGRLEGSGPSGSSLSALIDRAAADPTDVAPDEWTHLLALGGSELDDLVASADTIRRLTVGEAVSIVANRNLSSDRFGIEHEDGGGFSLIDVAEMSADAWDLGATEICVQGRIDASVESDAYLQIARTIKATVPGIHLHAFGPREIADLAARTGSTVAEIVITDCP